MNAGRVGFGESLILDSVERDNDNGHRGCWITQAWDNVSQELPAGSRENEDFARHVGLVDCCYYIFLRIGAELAQRGEEEFHYTIDSVWECRLDNRCELTAAGAGLAWEIRGRRLGLPAEGEEALSSRARSRTILRGQPECVMKTNSISHLAIDWGVGSCGLPMLPCPSRSGGQPQPEDEIK